MKFEASCVTTQELNKTPQFQFCLERLSVSHALSAWQNAFPSNTAKLTTKVQVGPSLSVKGTEAETHKDGCAGKECSDDDLRVDGNGEVQHRTQSKSCYVLIGLTTV